MGNKKILEKLDKIEFAFKTRERERWSKSERDEVLKRGEEPADFYQIWSKLIKLWAIKYWIKKYNYLPLSYKRQIEEWEEELNNYL